MPDKEEPQQNLADTFHRHGDLDPSLWEEQEAVTGRPADKPTDNSTFAERSQTTTTTTKAVEETEVENKAVKPSRARTKSK